MTKPKIALLSCGEEVYPQDWLKTQINDIWEGVKELNIDIVFNSIVMNESDAINTLECMEGKTYDLIIIHLVSWHITSNIMLILKKFKNIPLLVWSTGGKTDSTGKLHSPASPAALTALLPALREMGFKYKAIYEKPDQPHLFNEVERYAKVSKAYNKVRNSRIGLIGYADMGLYTCTYDRTSVATKLGIDVEDYFSYEIGQKMENVSEDEIKTFASDLRNKLSFENDVSEKIIDRVARLYYALNGKVNERKLDAISIKCVHGVTKYMGINPCMAQSLLANKDLSVICECDAYGLITNVMLSMLTNQTSAFMENYEFFDEEILVGTCGFLPLDFVDGTPKARSTNLGDFFVGLSNVSKAKEGLVTFARLYKSGDDYRMFLSKAEAKSPMKWIELGWEEPTPDFPSLLLKLEMPVTKYMEKVPGQHIILCYGDHTEDLKDLCKLMDIEVDEI